MWEWWPAQDFSIRGDNNGESESTLEHNMPTGPYLCLYQMLSKSFKPHTQGFTSSLEIHSGEVTRKQPQQRLSLLHMTHLLFDTNVSTKYYQNMSRGYQSYGHQDFGFREDNYIIKKKVRVVSLPCDTPTGPPLHLFQILSYYLKQYGSYGLHEILASGEITISGRRWELSLACYMPPLHFYQTLSKYV